MRQSDPTFRRFILSAVPSLAGWRTYRRTLLNLFVFGFAVLTGMWIVHQIEYALEYGHRFGSVMATTPHRFYMEPVSLLLVIGALIAGVVALSILGAGHLQLRRLRQHVPARLRAYLTTPLPTVPFRSIGLTALLLSGLQMGIYVLQENLEMLAATSSLPGLAVLVASPHLTVIPLHLLVASFSSLVLWTVFAWLHRSRQTRRLVQVLAALFAVAQHRATRPAEPRSYVPSRRLHAGSQGLRSPPLPACTVASLAARSQVKVA